MSRRIEELDWQQTHLGEISLRRRQDPVLGEVYEIKLNDEFLMSSAFTVAEEALATLALATLSGSNHRVAVGGLGLGFTALAVLQDPGVDSLLVIDALEQLIDWHRKRLIPAGTTLLDDPRCELLHADFFEWARQGTGDSAVDALLVDIDHSPSHTLNPSNAWFYTPEGVAAAKRLLRPGGVFALWSNDPPESWYTEQLAAVFGDVRAEVVSFSNPLQGGQSTNTIYLARD